jgi:hypothetical protein
MRDLREMTEGKADVNIIETKHKTTFILLSLLHKIILHLLNTAHRNKHESLAIIFDLNPI